MGWLWASSTSPDKAPSPRVVGRETASPSTSTPPPPEPAPGSSSDLSTDPEIQKFIDLFNAKPEPPNPDNSSQQLSDKSSSSSTSSWFSLRSSPSSPSQKVQVEAPPGDALSESLLPTEMSCRQAFDQAWACNSMGGQWNAVYRYGEMRSCSEHWDDFWFCMRTKSYGPEMREKAIRDHYRNKAYAKYGAGKPSSEDIWHSRDEKVESGTVFREPIE